MQSSREASRFQWNYKTWNLNYPAWRKTFAILFTKFLIFRSSQFSSELRPELPTTKDVGYNWLDETSHKGGTERGGKASLSFEEDTTIFSPSTQTIKFTITRALQQLNRCHFEPIFTFKFSRFFRWIYYLTISNFATISPKKIEDSKRRNFTTFLLALYIELND